MIAVITEANSTIGMGHYMRCSGIAERLLEHGKDCIFVLSSDSDTSLIALQKFNCIKLQVCESQGWCIQELSNVLENYHITTAIVDSYRLENDELIKLKKICKVIYIDDLNNYDFEVDVLINFNIEADVQEYLKYSVENRAVYTGVQYYPLRKEFIGKRKKYIKNNIEKVLITSGSTDPYKCVLQILSAIKPYELTQISFRILIGNFYKEEYVYELNTAFSQCENVDFVKWSGQIADEIESVDLVISPGSSMVMESLSLNVPCITYQFADNHHQTCVELERRGMAKWMGSFSDKVDKKKITDIFTANISYEERKKQSLKYSNFFDGKGMDRVIRIIVSTY